MHLRLELHIICRPLSGRKRRSLAHPWNLVAAGRLYGCVRITQQIHELSVSYIWPVIDMTRMNVHHMYGLDILSAQPRGRRLRVEHACCIHSRPRSPSLIVALHSDTFSNETNMLGRKLNISDSISPKPSKW